MRNLGHQGWAKPVQEAFPCTLGLPVKGAGFPDSRGVEFETAIGGFALGKDRVVIVRQGQCREIPDPRGVREPPVLFGRQKRGGQGEGGVERGRVERGGTQEEVSVGIPNADEARKGRLALPIRDLHFDHHGRIAEFLQILRSQPEVSEERSHGRSRFRLGGAGYEGHGRQQGKPSPFRGCPLGRVVGRRGPVRGRGFSVRSPGIRFMGSRSNRYSPGRKLGAARRGREPGPRTGSSTGWS